MRPYVVVAVQPSETPEHGGDADGREAGVARRRIGSPMVHGRADCHAGGHLVVQQSAHALPQGGAIRSYAASSDPAVSE